MNSRITARVVDVKRHTVGFILNNNKRVTRGQAVKMARSNQLKDVVAKKGVDSWYVTSLPSASLRLQDLPTVVRA